VLGQVSYSEGVCGTEPHIHQQLNLTRDGGDWSDSRPSHFIPPFSLFVSHASTKARTQTQTLNRRPGGPQSLSERLGGEKIFRPCRESSHGSSVIQPVY